MQRFLLRLGLTLVALLASSTAYAADDGDWTTCNRGDASSISACSAIIDSGGEDRTDLATAYNNRGAGYYSIGQADRAIADYDIAIELNPGFTEAYDNRGDARSENDRAGAIADFTRVLALEPERISTLKSRAVAYGAAGDKDRAITDLTSALSLDPTDPTAHKIRGDLLYDKGERGKAIADYTQAIRYKPGLAATWNNRGMAYLNSGDPDRAFENFDHAVRMQSDYPSPRLNRGLALRAKGDIATAKSDFAATLQLPGDDAEALDAKATARAALAALEKPAAPVETSERIALVIGNSAYRAVQPLRNPVNDAHEVAAEFRRSGFTDVVEKHDLTLAELSAALKAFGDKSASADWAVIYYAGHGIEVGGTNYIIPVDAELATTAHVEDEAIPLERLEAKVETGHQLRLIILDACRDNPFAKAIAGGGSRSIGRGLGHIEPSQGVTVAYSARDGHVALDGEGANGPFAQALVRHLKEPGPEIGLLFRKVHDTVWAATQGEQEPSTYGALPAQALYFKAAGNG